MENVKILCLHPIFSENSIIMATRLGVQIEKVFEPQRGQLYIVYGAHTRGAELLEIQKQHNYTYYYVIMQSEVSQSTYLQDKFYIELMKSNFVFDFSNISAKYLKDTFDINVKSFHFFDFITYNHTEPPVERDIDILFVGAKSQKRENVYDSLQKEFPDKNIEFIFDNSLLTPTLLTDKLTRTKYVVNISFYDNTILETHRINKALCCGCGVISLPSGDTTTDEFYKDYIHFTDDIVNAFREEIKSPLKSYSDLQLFLTNKLFIHNQWMINKINKKVCSI